MLDLSKWNILHRIFFSILIVIIITGLAYKISFEKQHGVIKSSKSNITTKMNEFKKNNKLIADLPVVKKEVEILKANLEDLLKYLPDEVSMPHLLDSVYQSGKDSNIIFDEFKPGRERSTGEYYVIKPISIRTKTGYINLASFIQSIASLERIVNVFDVSVRKDNRQRKEDNNKSKANVKNTPLDVSMEMQTYIFSETKTANSRRR